MPVAVITFEFEPVIRLAEFAVRLDTLVAALGVLLALIVAALLARRTPAPGNVDFGATLRLDDLLFIALAAMPGALIGGRIGYVLLHRDYYAANAAAILDPGQGSLELTLAVVGGAVTGGVAAAVLTGALGRWLHVATIPTLIALGVGKLSMALGGAGQGTPWEGDWATRYMGAGPWGSLAPEIASHPAQLYEAVAVGVIALVVGTLLAAGLFNRRNGTPWLLAVGLWAAARAVIASTWRDPVVVPPLRAEQAICLAVLAGCLGLTVWLMRRPRATAEPVATGPEPHWPDPEARPQF